MIKNLMMAAFLFSTSGSTDSFSSSDANSIVELSEVRYEAKND